MKRVLWLLMLAACGDDARDVERTTLACPNEQREREVDGDTERWCATDGVADGAYLRLRGDWVLQEGAFFLGQPTGHWTDWYSPDDVDAPQAKLTYGFAAAHVEGEVVAYAPDGSTIYTRYYDRGEPCGSWTGTLEQSFRPCSGAPVAVDPNALDLRSPYVTKPEPDCPNASRHEGDTYWCEVDGHRDGTWLRVYPGNTQDGFLVAEIGAYHADLKSGTWRRYRSDGSLVSVGAFVDGLADGAWETRDARLLLASVGTYDAGLKSGVWTDYVDGVAVAEESWVAGVRQGAFTHWFPAGGVEREGQYRDGLRDGLVTTYWENGNPRFATTYVADVATGPHRQYFEDGALEAEGSYDDGVAIGAWTSVSDPDFLVTFFGGPAEPVTYHLSYSDGLVDGPVEGRYAGDAIAVRATARRGSLEGAMTLYWPDGTTLAEGAREGGANQGPWKSYYPSGASRATWPFARGLLAGDFTELWENGNLRRTGRYVDDLRVGVWTTYDESGAVLASENCGGSGEACR